MMIANIYVNAVLSLAGVCLVSAFGMAVAHKGVAWCGWWVVCRLGAALDVWEAGRAVWRVKVRQYEAEAGVRSRKSEQEVESTVCITDLRPLRILPEGFEEWIESVRKVISVNEKSGRQTSEAPDRLRG